MCTDDYCQKGEGSTKTATSPKVADSRSGRVSRSIMQVLGALLQERPEIHPSPMPFHLPLSQTAVTVSSSRQDSGPWSPNQAGMVMCHEADHCQRNGVPELKTSEKSHIVTYPSSLSLRIGQRTIQTSSLPKQMTPTDRECSLWSISAIQIKESLLLHI